MNVRISESFFQGILLFEVKQVKIPRRPRISYQLEEIHLVNEAGDFGSHPHIFKKESFHRAPKKITS